MFETRHILLFGENCHVCQNIWQPKYKETISYLNKKFLTTINILEM